MVRYFFKWFVALIVLITSATVFGQEQPLLPVTIADLQSDFYPADSSASAAVLYSRCQHKIIYSKDIFKMRRESSYKFRIKIYTKEGLQYATRNIAYLVGSDATETVVIDKAVTYNLVNGNITTTSLSTDGVFDEQVVKGVVNKRVVMPDAKEKCIIELYYTISSPMVFYIPQWDFQQEIPVKYSELITVIPTVFNFNAIFRGFYQIDQKKLTYEKNNITEEYSCYTAYGLPALKDVSLVNNIDNYTCSVEHELKRFSKMGKSINLSPYTWQSIARRIYKDEDFVGQLNKTGYFTEDVDQVIKGLNTPEEKMQAIFSFVQQRITFNQRISVVCNQGVKAAYKDKTGNVAEINLMLTSMLRYAGIEAYPVLQCHRKSRIALSPAYDAFNYVTCAAIINGKEVLLDASSKWSRPGVLPLRAINWAGLMLKDGDIKDVNVMPETPSLKTTILAVTLNPDAGCSGKIRVIHYDHYAAMFRETYAENPDTEASATAFEKEYSGLQISNYRVGDLKNNTKPVTEDMDFTNSNAAELLGNRIYISPLILFSTLKNPFTEKERLYPIDFGFPQQQKYSVSIKLPEGLSTESVPESVTYKLPDDLASFKFLSESSSDSIKMVITITYNKAVIAAEHYAGLKEFYDKVIEKFKQKIILIKTK